MDDVGILKGLLEAYSPSGHEKGSVDFFVGAAQELGFLGEIDGAGNGIAAIGSGRPSVMFLGHVDTVEGALPVKVSDGRIYGRGACDAKGPLAAALISAASHRGPGEIIVVAAVGEEQDSRGSRFLVSRHNPDFLIVGEPSGWSGVTIGYKGSLSLELSFDGERTHITAPVATTVEAALAFLKRLELFCERNRGPSAFSSLSAKIHTIETHRHDGKEHVDVGVNFRLPPNVKSADVVQFLEKEEPAVRYRVVDRSEAVEVDRANEVVRSLCLGIRRNGGRPTLLRKLGTADLNVVAQSWRCPAAAYGPGDSHLDHTDAENVQIAEFRKSIRVLESAFGNLAANAKQQEKNLLPVQNSPRVV